MNTPLPQPIWVDNRQALQEITQTLLQQPSIAVDTESNSLHAYKEQVCLIQFSTATTDYLVDPLAFDDLSPLAGVFSSEKIEKIFHACEYDVLCLKRDYGFEFANLFDTMIAARILGIHEIGLNNMLQAEFGVELDKRYQKADWGKRPLPDEYKNYAQMDTHYLHMLRKQLGTRIRDKGLDALANEEFMRMTRVTAGPVTTPEEQIWHINGARDLTSRQAAILLELLKWRERKACEMNRPPFKVIGNEEIVEIAFTQASSINSLKIRAHISERLLDRYGSEIIHTVECGQKRPPLRYPGNNKPDQSFRLRVDRLKDFRKKAAAQLQVESDIILPRDLLYQLAENPPASWSEFESRMELYPWRMQHYGKQIFSAIQPHNGGDE